MGYKWMAAAVALASPSMATAEDLKLELVCVGTGTFPEMHSSTAFVQRSNGESATAEGFSSSKGVTSAQFRISIDGATGKVKVPRMMIPVIHGGAEAGWFAMSNVTADEATIRGKFSLNFLNHPSVVIDRRTGEVDMKGLAHFSFTGNCRPDVSSERKF